MVCAVGGVSLHALRCLLRLSNWAVVFSSKARGQLLFLLLSAFYSITVLRSRLRRLTALDNIQYMLDYCIASLIHRYMLDYCIASRIHRYMLYYCIASRIHWYPTWTTASLTCVWCFCMRIYKGDVCSLRRIWLRRMAKPSTWWPRWIVRLSRAFECFSSVLQTPPKCDERY